MQEPRPVKIDPPNGTEPQLKVGIVLPEDGKRRMTFSLPDDRFCVQAEGESIQLHGGKSYILVSVDGSAALRLEGREICRVRDAISIAPLSPRPLQPQYGIKLDAVVAGRTFHWRKEIAQTLPGALYAHAADEKLILVNQVSFEDYTACVLSSEMAAGCPAEFIKAQAVAARSWALVFLHNKHSGLPYTICNDDDCQRYQGTTHLHAAVSAAVEKCCGEFLIAKDGFVCAAYYSKSCGGISEEPKNVLGFAVSGLTPALDCPQGMQADVDLSDEAQFESWLNTAHPAQRDVFCSPQVVAEPDLPKYLGAVDESGSYYRWSHSISEEELIKNLKERFRLGGIRRIVDIVPGSRGYSGRILKLTVRYQAGQKQIEEFTLNDQYDIRRALHSSFLFSSAFKHSWREDLPGKRTLTMQGLGWGHGMGLCQIGAVGMALKGYKYREILKHYYPECQVVKSY